MTKKSLKGFFQWLMDDCDNGDNLVFIKTKGNWWLHNERSNQMFHIKLRTVADYEDNIIMPPEGEKN